jgi:hypothetical protein
VQLNSSASDYNGIENLPGSHLVKAFQVIRRILDDVSSITEAPSLQS